MAEVITFGIQKGGSSKTTTTVVTAYILAEQGNKVLVIDTDSQGNATDALTQKSLSDFANETLLEAVKAETLKGYIHHTTHENIDVVASDDFLATLPRYLYTSYRRNINTFLKDLLDDVKDNYDYILIDTPPSLNELTVNAIVAADHVVVLAESSKWATLAIERFLETVAHAQLNFNSNLEIAGILMNLIDARRTDNIMMIDDIRNEYDDLVFKTTVKRKAATGRISLFGLQHNHEIKEAVKPYIPFVNELKERIKHVQTN